MKVLLSIKPEFVERIFSGEKRFEFRKSLFKRDDVTAVVVYATQPVGRIVGEFEIAEILTDTPEALWRRTSHASGISKSFFDSYFEGRDRAHAIAIGNFRRFEKEIEPSELFADFNAPQGYQYLSDSMGRVAPPEKPADLQLSMQL